jgi:hypothetical protein
MMCHTLYTTLQNVVILFTTSPHIGVRSAWVTGNGIVVLIHTILCTKVCILSIQAQQMMATSAFTRSDLHFV